MNCVVAITDGKAVWMGADSAVINGDEISQTKTKKVIRRNRMLIGWVGNFRIYRAIMFAEGFPRCKEKEDHEHYIARVCQWLEILFGDNPPDSDLIIGYGGRIWHVGEGFAISDPSEPYYSIGCGSGFAVAVLESKYGPDSPPDALILEALEVSERRSLGVRGPFYVEKI